MHEGEFEHAMSRIHNYRAYTIVHGFANRAYFCICEQWTQQKSIQKFDDVKTAFHLNLAIRQRISIVGTWVSPWFDWGDFKSTKRTPFELKHFQMPRFLLIQRDFWNTKIKELHIIVPASNNQFNSYAGSTVEDMRSNSKHTKKLRDRKLFLQYLTIISFLSFLNKLSNFVST